MFLSLHGLRALAAISVLLFHWGSAIGFFSYAQKLTSVDIAGVSFSILAPLDFGWLGVPVFFILSAVLLGAAWQEKELSFSSYGVYLRRRFLRIFPAFWLQLVLLALLAPVLGIVFELEGVWHFIKHSLLLINLPPWMDKPLNPVWWTLPVEFGFYLVLPLLAVVFRNKSALCLLLFGFVVTVAWRLFVFSSYETDNYAPYIYTLDALPGVLFTFCLGLALVLHGSGRLFDKLIGVGGFAASILVLLVLTLLLKVNVETYWSGGTLLLLWPAAVAVCLVMIIARYLHHDSRILSAKPLQYLGDISFGIYLWHYPVLQYLSKIMDSLPHNLFTMLLSLGLTFLLTIIIAHLSYRFVERPCMQMFR